MSSSSHDKGFAITAAVVMGALTVFTIAIMVIAGVLSKDSQSDPAAAARVEARIAPLGKVVTDAAELLKASAAEPHTPLAGDQVVAQVCSGCHAAGVLGAPKIGDKGAWSAREKSDGGVDGLLSWALKGKNQMPPRGGRPDLTDAEVKAAIQQMLKQSGA